ncbi:MAG: sigma-70 family RNA polymerase sigma factor [Gemmataceae bacterium]|nr:sigma-70 family RNA polymerase sigma factor [Gemmataceae bacterium]
MSEPTTVVLESLLDRLRAGDASARDGLIEHAAGNLSRLVRKMLPQFPGVKRWEDADDVRQNASLRLWRSLEEVRPATVRDFLRLAALQIRRELLDLARHYGGPEGQGANHASVGAGAVTPPPAHDPGQTTHDPAKLAQWTEFHAQVDALPEEQREAFDLLYYQDLPQAEAAALLGISEATLRRRWLAARLGLQEKMKGG